jgi:hypothetical protein
MFLKLSHIYNVSSIKSKLYYISFVSTFYITNVGQFLKAFKTPIFSRSCVNVVSLF